MDKTTITIPSSHMAALRVTTTTMVSAATRLPMSFGASSSGLHFVASFVLAVWWCKPNEDNANNRWEEWEEWVQDEGTFNSSSTTKMAWLCRIRATVKTVTSRSHSHLDGTKINHATLMWTWIVNSQCLKTTLHHSKCSLFLTVSALKLILTKKKRWSKSLFQLASQLPLTFILLTLLQTSTPSFWVSIQA